MSPVGEELRARLLSAPQPIVTLSLACPYYNKPAVETMIEAAERRIQSAVVDPLNDLEKLGLSVLLSSAGMTRKNGEPW